MVPPPSRGYNFYKNVKIVNIAKIVNLHKNDNFLRFYRNPDGSPGGVGGCLGGVPRGVFSGILSNAGVPYRHPVGCVKLIVIKPRKHDFYKNVDFFKNS